MKLGLAKKDSALARTLNDLLFTAFFVENANLADWEVLITVGKKAGLDGTEVLAMLKSDKYEKEVRSDEIEAARHNAHGVPYFVFENGTAILGAVPVEDLELILENIEPSSSCGTQCGMEGCGI